MGILGTKKEKRRSSGGILGRKEREQSEIRRSMPEVFNPFAQREAVQERFTPTPTVRQPVAPAVQRDPFPDYLRALDNNKPFNPTFDEILAHPSQVKDARSPADKWVDERLARDKEQAAGNPVTRAINKFLSPASEVVYGAAAKIPGVASFQRGAAEGAGTQSFAPPVEDSNWFDKIAGFAGNVAGSAANFQGAGIPAVQAPLDAGRAVAGAVGSRVPRLAGNAASRAIEGVVGGGVAGAADSALRGQTDIKDVGTGTAYGAGLGLAGEAAIGGISKAAQKILEKYRPAPVANKPLELPAPAQRGNANRAETPDVITPEYQFGLPEPSATSTQKANNISQGKADLKVIDDELRQLQADYDRAVVDEFNYLRQSLEERGGVLQGQIQRDAAGNVVGKTGRISNNPKWYQDFYAESGKTPTKKDLYRLAKERVDNGFADESGNVPSWKERSGYNEKFDTFKQVRSTISRSLDELSGIKSKEPTDLNELVQRYGYREATPDNIAQVYNDKNWYHGTGSDLTAEKLDPFVGSHESLFGQGIYLTDSPKIAQGYAGSRGKRTKSPNVYESNVKLDRVLDLEKPPEPDAVYAIDKTAQNLDYQYEQQFGERRHFSNLIQEELDKGVTTEDLILKIKEEIKDFSHAADIPTTQFVDNFQDLAINLKQAGYDGLTHTGGHRTGKAPHRVLILLDPQNWHGKTGQGRAVRRFEKYTPDAGLREQTLRDGTVLTDTPLKVEKTKGVLRKKSATPEPTETPAPSAVAADVDIAPKNLPAADQSSGISAFGGSKKRTKVDPEDLSNYVATKTDREPIDVKRAADVFYRNNVDNLQRINDFDKFIEKEIGRKLTPSERSYYLALNSRGSDMTAKHILTERLVDSQGRAIGESLKDITSQIPSNPQTYKNFMAYLVAKHAPTRMERGERVYPPEAKMTIDKVNAKVAEYEKNYPEFKQLAEELYGFDKKLNQAWLVDTGLFPQSVIDAWEEANPNWSPNQRKFTPLEKRKQSAGAKKGFGNQNQPVKAYNKDGSGREIIDPIESRIEYVDRYVKTARRNEVMQTIYKQLQKNPEELSDFATVVKKEKLDPGDDPYEGVEKLIDQLDEEFTKATYRKSDIDKDNIVSALVDGERVYMKIEDPDLLDALVNVSPQARNAIIEFARKATNTMKNLTTGINPVFGLTRNIFRDIPEAYIFSKTTDNPFKYAFDFLDGLTSVMAEGAKSGIDNSRTLQKVAPDKLRRFLSERAKLYQDYKGLGGGHSSPAAANRNLLAQSKQELLPQQRKGIKALGKKGLAAIENLNNAIESAPRLGEFKRVRKAGGDTYASRVKGIFEANDVTTNFKRHGQIVKDADAVIPYLNAAVQGSDKFARAFKDRPAATVAKSLGVIGLPTVFLYAINHDNPEYRKLNNFTKDNFFLIPTTGGKFIKIPKPRELGVPFGGMLERVLRAWKDDDPEAFKGFADTVATTFTPPGLPVKELSQGKLVDAAVKPVRDTILGPLVDIASNENFMGAPIVPGYLENVSPELQADASTSNIAKWIGEMTKSSPKQIDHLIKSYTGVIGQLGLPAATDGASIGETLERQVTADPVFSTDASSNFYELKDKLDTMYADAKATGVAPKGYDDAARKYLNSVAGQMSDYTKAIREVDKSKTLSGDEKEKYKRQFTEQRNELARKAYIAVRDALK